MFRRANSQTTIPGLDVAKAKRYSRVRLLCLGLSTVWSLVGLGLFAKDRRAMRLKHWLENRVPDVRLAAPLFLAACSVIAWLAGLLAAFLGGHVVERSFGLTKQTARGWLADQIKAMLVGLVVRTPLLALLFSIIRRRPRDWWLIVAGASAPLIALLSHLAPLLLMPLFNRIVPLRDEALARRLRQLAVRGGVSISDVYEIDMSRQSEKPNAMFTGLGSTKRIVLGDTMLQRFPPEEVEAVVAHELGHQVHGDIWRMIGFSTGATFLAAWVTSLLTPRLIRRTARWTGIADIGDEASLPILGVVTSAIGMALMPIQAAFSRSIERRADRFAIELTGDGETYARTMERLATQSLSDPDPPWPVVVMLYSHPPIAERIQAARAANPTPM
jgi:STE24 endopeptidase